MQKMSNLMRKITKIVSLYPILKSPEKATLPLLYVHGTWYMVHGTLTGHGGVTDGCAGRLTGRTARLHPAGSTPSLRDIPSGNKLLITAKPSRLSANSFCNERTINKIEIEIKMSYMTSLVWPSNRLVQNAAPCSAPASRGVGSPTLLPCATGRPTLQAP